MPRREQQVTLDDALGAPPVASSEPDAEAASAALSGAVETGEPPAQEVSRPTRHRPRLKAEIEHENEQLKAEIARRDAAQTSPEAVADLGVAIGESFGIVFGVISTMQGPHWALGKQEKESLGRVWAPCLAPVLAQYPQTVAWGLAIGSTVAIVGPRVAIDRQRTQLKKGEPEREPTDKANSGDSGSRDSVPGDSSRATVSRQ